MESAGTKRVLIYRLGSLGDTVVALPALHLVARSFPNARRLLLTNIPVHAKAPAAASVIGDSGLIHGFISYPVGTRNFITLAKLWLRIILFRPQVLVYLAESRGEQAIRRDLRFFKSCGIPEIIGAPLGPSAGWTRSSKTGLWEGESARLARMVQSLGECDLEDRRNWDLGLTVEEQNSVNVALAPLGDAPLITCGPGTKMQAKDWGAENWRQLMALLSAKLPHHALLLVGAKEDAAVSQSVGTEWRGPVLNLCGKLTPRTSAAVIGRSELFLGPDSGPMHLAALSGVPCAIAFAARTKPGIWYPAGQGHRIIYHHVDCAECGLETCVEQNRKCLASITVEEMLNAAMDAWTMGRKKGAAAAV